MKIVYGKHIWEFYLKIRVKTNGASIEAMVGRKYIKYINV